MVRFLLIVVALWLAVMIARHLLRAHKQVPHARRQLPERDMVRCAECGLHVPRHEAIADGERFYCSDRHRRAHHQSRQT